MQFGSKLRILNSLTIWQDTGKSGKMFNGACVCWGLSHAGSVRHSRPSSSRGQSCSPSHCDNYKCPHGLPIQIEQRSVRWGSAEGVKHVVKCADWLLSVLWSCRRSAGRERSGSRATPPFSELLSVFPGISSLSISYILLFYLFLTAPPLPFYLVISLGMIL